MTCVAPKDYENVVVIAIIIITLVQLAIIITTLLVIPVTIISPVTSTL